MEAEGGKEDWRKKSEDFMEKMVRFGLGNKMGTLGLSRHIGIWVLHISILGAQ